MNTNQTQNQRNKRDGQTPPRVRRTPTKSPSDNQGKSGVKRQSHPAVKKEPHYPSSSRPSSEARASKPNGTPCDEDVIKGREKSSAVSALLKAIIYIMAVLVVSGCLSVFAITVGNDVFAFVKSDQEITISIPEGISVKQLGKILEKNGVIEYGGIFNLYAKLRDKNPTFVAGEYTVKPSMNYDQLINVFAKSSIKIKETVIVVIPEGYTVKKVVDTLVDKYGLSTKEELYDVIENYDFDYWFIDQLDSNISKDRMYRLEGYLYPDTYYYYTDASAVTIINKMLSNFDLKMKQTFKNCTAPGADYIEKINNLCKTRNKTFDEIVTLASLIQMEAFYDVEYGTISSVFNNRLNNPKYETNGMLESDATLYYILQDDPPEELTQEHINMVHPYNTRKNKGLPPGPITNSTYLAINYAIYPESTKYYYFVARKDGYNLFAKTLKEHRQNVEIAKGDIEEE